jgi:hypothetical protein
MTQVNHKQFGTGTVVSNDAKTVSVNFNGEVKTLGIKFANLTNEDGSTWKPSKEKVVKAKSYLFNEICKEDQNFLIRTGIVDLGGNMVDSDIDTLIKVHAAKNTGEWA